MHYYRLLAVKYPYHLMLIYVYNILFINSLNINAEDFNINTNILNDNIKSNKTPKIIFNHSSLQQNNQEWLKIESKLKGILIHHNFSHWSNKTNKNGKEIFTKINRKLKLRVIEFKSYDSTSLTLFIIQPSEINHPKLLVLNPLNEKGFTDFLATMQLAFMDYLNKYDLPKKNIKSFDQNQRMFSSFNWAMAYLIPTGLKVRKKSIEFKTKNIDAILEPKMIHDKLRVGDIRRGIQTLRNEGGYGKVSLWLQAESSMAKAALYASIFEPKITRLDLYDLKDTKSSDNYFNKIESLLSIPSALAIAIKNTQIIIYQESDKKWEYPNFIADKLGWQNRVKIRPITE